MRIERIDDKTVKCYISNEELKEYDLDYKDFITRSEKAREIVHEIMEQAVEEVGYHPPQFAIDLQIMVVPEQGLVLTFSEKDPLNEGGNERLRDCLQEMKDILQKTREQITNKQLAEDGEQVPLQEQPDADVKSKEKARPEFSVFAFDTLEQLGSLAAVLPTQLRVVSRVYRHRNGYYLYMARGNAAYERYAKACVQALEFGRLYSAEEESLSFLEEHAQCLIEEKALRKLAKIYG